MEHPVNFKIIQTSKNRRRNKVMEENFSMAFKYKFNTFVLPYLELDVTGDGEVILEKVSLQLCPFPIPFLYPPLLAISENS